MVWQIHFSSSLQKCQRQLRAIRAHGVPSITNPSTPPLFQLETLPDWGDRRHPIRDFHRGRWDILETQIDDDPYDDPYPGIRNDPCDPDFDFKILEVRHQRRPPLDRSVGELKVRLDSPTFDGHLHIEDYLIWEQAMESISITWRFPMNDKSNMFHVNSMVE